MHEAVSALQLESSVVNTLT